MKRITKSISVLLLAAALCMITGEWQPVYAASAALSFVPEAEEAEAGKEITVMLQITADTTIGDFEGYFTYDAEVMEYTFGPSCITGDDGYLKISDIEASPSNALRTYVMTFTALKPGICQFAMSGAPVVYEYTDGNPMSVMSEPYSLRVTASADASDNADISTLRVSPGTLIPDFDPEVTEYEVTVSDETERLIVSAVPQDLNASVSVAGNAGLITGENNVSITVTAENGDTKTYHILTIRAEKGEIPTPESEKTPKDESEKGLSVMQESGITVLSGEYRYQLAEISEQMTIPEGYAADYLLLDGVNIPVYTKDSQPEYCLISLINETGETGWYRFDRMEYTVQCYEPEVITVRDDSQTAQKINELLAKTSQYEKDRNKMSIVTGILGALVALLAVLCIRLYVHSRGYDDDLD